MINAVEPAAGPVSGNHHIYVTFRNLNPLPSQLNRTETELLLEPMCAFPNVTVPGSFHVATAHFPWAYIRCNTPPWSAGAVNLSVSLNGQEWSVQPGTYTYLVTSQLSAADIAAYQAGNDPEAFTSWIDYQTDGSGIVTEFYNAFYGVAESENAARLASAAWQRA